VETAPRFRKESALQKWKEKGPLLQPSSLGDEAQDAAVVLLLNFGLKGLETIDWGGSSSFVCFLVAGG
jgi:hypothetical protein